MSRNVDLSLLANDALLVYQKVGAEQIVPFSFDDAVPDDDVRLPGDRDDLFCGRSGYGLGDLISDSSRDISSDIQFRKEDQLGAFLFCRRDPSLHHLYALICLSNNIPC